jgi:hypothetical protein
VAATPNTNVLTDRPSIYIIHDDRDRGLVEVLTRRLAAAGFSSWGRGQRRPGNQGAENLLARARVCVLLVTNTTSESQLVHVDLTRAGRLGLPLARLIMARSGETYGAENSDLGGVTAYEGLSDNTMEELLGIIKDKARAGSMKSGLQRVRAAISASPGRASPDEAGPDTAATLGRQMTLMRVLPIVLIIGAAIGAVTYWWWQQNQIIQREAQRARPRLVETAGMQSLTPSKFIAPFSNGAQTLELPPGIVRAGYEAEPAPTNLEIAEGAAQLQVTKIVRGVFRMDNGVRVSDLELTVENPTQQALPVVALAIAVRDAARLKGDERLIKLERQWVPPGGLRIIKGTLSDLPPWASTISVLISQTKA